MLIWPLYCVGKFLLVCIIYTNSETVLYFLIFSVGSYFEFSSEGNTMYQIILSELSPFKYDDDNTRKTVFRLVEKDLFCYLQPPPFNRSFRNLN